MAKHSAPLIVQYLSQEEHMIHIRTFSCTLPYFYRILICASSLQVVHCNLDLQWEPPNCSLEIRSSAFEYSYSQEGDIIIGGVFNVHYVLYEKRTSITPPLAICMLIYPQYYRHILAFIFAIDEINKNPDILPNVTLGFHAFDSCGDVNQAILSVIHIISGPSKTVPNYSCMKQDKLVGFIADLPPQTSLSVAYLLGVYSYTQTIFRATDHMLRDTVLYPSLFRTAEDDEIQFAAISDLLVHFGWTWVGIIASDNDNGEKESHELIKQLTRRKICIEFVLVVKEEGAMNENLFYGENIKILQASTSRVAIICGSVSVFFFIALEEGRQNLYNKTLIFTSSWIFNLDLEASPIITFNGSLAFTIPSRHIPGMQNFLESVHPSSRPTDFLLEDIWLQFFRCFTSNQPKNEMYEAIYKSSLRNCTGEERIVDISDVVYDTNNFRTSYQVYSAVYTMAHALHNIYTSGSANSLSKYKQQLKRYMRKVHFKDPAGEEIYFNEKGMIPTKYHIINRVVFANGSFLVRQVGSFSMMEPEGQQLLINDRDIIWKESNNEVPQSLCSKKCLQGYRRVLQEGKPICCYYCVRCSEGEISTQIDSDVCRQCPDNQWPNERSNTCLPKTLEFLSYETDVIASVFSFFSILFSFLTAIVLGIFVSFRDTPIVKANNQNVSFVLLVSLIVSFLCVFLFLGRPVHTTCILRQTCFGIIFSIAVSSVLAKTIMVYIAFKATKPNNVWKKYLGVKMSNIIVTTCSFIQVVICVSWLAFSPPFQELNMTSHPGKIIIKCNEGSSVAFYCVLGYIGCLATLSFFVAFLVRALPDNFNEGKYITFSMLLFCCVWICVIPVYLSTEGKNMVTVEVFAILISTAGLLSCIFFPKCYIILWRPEQNTKQHLMGKISK